MRIGTCRSAASAKTGASRSSSRRNACARGWSLIPRAPASSARVASSTGCSEPRERDQHAVRCPRCFEGTVVRSSKGGLAVGLVETEGERARDAVFGEEVEQVVQLGDEAVYVGADVHMGVEEL